jgi:hypothetical protein
VAFVKSGNNVDEMKLDKKRAKSWAKVWQTHERGFDDGNTFENIMTKLGRKLDDGQLEMVDDWSYIQVEIRQYNGRVIDVELKCKRFHYERYENNG